MTPATLSAGEQPRIAARTCGSSTAACLRRHQVRSLSIAAAVLAAVPASSPAHAQPAPAIEYAPPGATQKFRLFIGAGLGLYAIREVEVGDGLGVEGGIVTERLPLAPSLTVTATYDFARRVGLTAQLGLAGPVASTIALLPYGSDRACPAGTTFSAYETAEERRGRVHDASSAVAHLSVGVRMRPFAPYGRYYLGAGAFALLLTGGRGGAFATDNCIDSNAIDSPSARGAPVTRPGEGSFTGAGAGVAFETGVLLGSRREFDLSFRGLTGVTFGRSEGIGGFVLGFGWSPL